jgi:tetratricopeptide (TPR) repeat protein
VAKVSLRNYNREIENLIDQGLQDEAIAHCSHILKALPKHLETYRLLGKSYLEAKRYDQAVDIFQRVLAAVPDDFVSHVGMSIIRDDQGKLDDSIWHMERAFESQPSNAAIQGELRRLYGRRDGVEPPKIRMTRGALAHMYVQGELFPQAISEIKAVLGQDSQRVDMQVLLALAYFRSGQKADAAEICNKLLARPGGENCFDANRIMLALQQGSDSPDDVEVHRQRVNQMDPYAAFAQSSAFQSGAVSDGAVTLERHEYSGQRVEMGTDWGARGIGVSSSASQAQPDWLSTPAPASAPAPAPVANSPEEIPDFLRQAGWSESSGAAEEAPLSFSIEETPPVSASELSPGDMPDWLKAMSPSEPEAESQEDEPSAMVNPFAEFGSIPAPEPRAAAPIEPSPAPAAEDVPDWLSGLGGAAEPATASSTETPIAPDDTPAWLSGLGGAAEPAPLPSTETPAAHDDTPAWLSGLGEADAPAASAPIPAGESSLPDWLTPEKPEQVEEQPAAPAVSSPPVGSLETLGASAQEQDDAVAWLESLASKHGAKAEELVTDPNARSETPPEWVEQARAIAESQPPAPVPAKPEALEIASEDETGIWLSGLAEKDTFSDFQSQTESDATLEIPIEPEKDIIQAEPIRPVSIESPALAEDDDKPAWLRNLENDDTPPVGSLVAQPQADPEESESPVDLPAWLQGLDQGQDQAAPESETVEASSLSLEMQNELPGWLQEDEVAETAVPTAPTDWQPVGPAAGGGAAYEEQGQPEFEPQAEAIQPAPPKKPAPEPRASTPAAAPARPRQPAEKPALVPDAALEKAQADLSRGDVQAALVNYGKLIKRGRFTEEIIRDLREALYRYPVEVTVWQALGDAYMRANRLQVALDAYTKAEELLR